MVTFAICSGGIAHAQTNWEYSATAEQQAESRGLIRPASGSFCDDLRATGSSKCSARLRRYTNPGAPEAESARLRQLSDSVRAVSPVPTVAVAAKAGGTGARFAEIRISVVTTGNWLLSTILAGQYWARPGILDRWPKTTRSTSSAGNDWRKGVPAPPRKAKFGRAGMSRCATWTARQNGVLVIPSTTAMRSYIACFVRSSLTPSR